MWDPVMPSGDPAESPVASQRRSHRGTPNMSRSTAFRFFTERANSSEVISLLKSTASRKHETMQLRTQLRELMVDG